MKYKFKLRFYVICLLAAALITAGAAHAITYFETDAYAAEPTSEPTTLETYEEAADMEEAVAPELDYLGEFKITYYCSCEQCCGKTDGITYSGKKAKAGRTIAVDPDVIPLGSIVIIGGHYYVAEDIGGAIEGNRIDVYCSSHDEALENGVKTEKVYASIKSL